MEWPSLSTSFKKSLDRAPFPFRRWLIYARLSPGHYDVQVDASGGLIPKRIRAEDTEAMQEGFTISHSGKAPLEIALSHDGATIEGIGQKADGQPVPGATVVLIPGTKLRSRHGLYRETSTDQFGRYHFGAVTPGDYKLFAWSDVEPDIWFDPAVSPWTRRRNRG
jgi:hypothetical protein